MYIVAQHIISPLGNGTQQNFDQALKGHTGIKLIDDKQLYPSPFYGSRIGNFEPIPSYTRLESLFIKSIASTLDQLQDLDKSRTVLILSTTKGNIDLLDNQQSGFPGERLELPHMAEVVNSYFDMPDKPVVISNACISGVSAMLTAQKLIRSGQYDHAIVSGADLLTEFIVSGFQCLMAIDEKPCQPYDKARAGITLGEACATVVITNENNTFRPVAKILGGAQSNDANHISGPSRTGEGLKLSIEQAGEYAQIDLNKVDYINAHGTATVFNDEMESIAFNRMKLGGKPLNSLKGYFGHTLGAAGLIETIFAIAQAQNNTLLPTYGFKEPGVSKPLNVVKEVMQLESKPRYVLKTVSGFGGCNAAIILEVL